MSAITRLYKLFTVALVLAAAGMGYRLLRSSYKADIYRQRLSTLAKDYDDLRGQYNQAVKRTAVTELWVEDGRLQVTIRDATGKLRCIPTPFDPHKEVYVDYVVIDGRLWIRRVFDENTPPSEALVIDPKLAEIDWDSAAARTGKAVYRSLDDGRWVVTVTGDGSLGLSLRDEHEPEASLETAPPVREFGPVEEAVSKAIEQVTAGEVVKRVIGGGSAEK